MSRVRYAAKNILFGSICNLTYTLLGFVLRTIFLEKLGETLLGVNGLYTGILSAVSLAELGIGTAMNYSLYGPTARQDYEKIKSYMAFFRKAYIGIAAVVTCLGLLVIPFLPVVVKDPIGLTSAELVTYYLIFLFNTVTTYFMAYKYSLANAEQKNYIQTNAATISKLVTTVIQIIILMTTADFLWYLLTVAIVELLQKIVMNCYLNRKYPYLKEKNVKKLSRQETKAIIADTKALAIQKVGDAARLQTDPIIISTFINVTLVGFIDNYNMVIAAVTGFVDNIFNSVISGFGNVMATESKERQYSLFKVYRFAAAWLYGFSAMGFWFLLSDFVEIAWGKTRVLGFWIIFCIIFDYYCKGERIVLYNFKTAAGIFKEDRYLAFLQGIVNLIVSIVMIQQVGLIGVYIGTVVSGLMANFIRPFLLYGKCFDKPVLLYFKEVLRYIVHLALSACIILPVYGFIMTEKTWLRFIVMAIVITGIFNGLFYLCFRKTKEFAYLYGIVRKRLQREKKV